MKVVILDRCTVTKGDVSLCPLEAFGETEYFDMLSKNQIIDALQGADVVVCNKSVIDKDIMDATDLKLICLFATGYNNIDIEYARKKGISVCNVPGYSTDSVTQVTISFVLELASSTSKYVSSVANGDWKRASQFSYFDFPITELAGKTLGIFGLGTIGQSVARVARALGMNVIAYTRTPKNIDGITEVDEKSLFIESDFLSFHCPLTKETALIVNERTLSLMKQTAYIINTARGGIIDEKALAAALKDGRIAGAALDVLTSEPMAVDCPLWGIDNCIITPHIAWASLESRTRLITMVAGNIKSFVYGTPINIVN